jgi:hypothetical protein
VAQSIAAINRANVACGSKLAVLGVLSERPLSDPEADLGHSLSEGLLMAEMRPSRTARVDPFLSFEFVEAKVSYGLEKQPFT